MEQVRGVNRMSRGELVGVLQDCGVGGEGLRTVPQLRRAARACVGSGAALVRFDVCFGSDAVVAMLTERGEGVFHELDVEVGEEPEDGVEVDLHVLAPGLAWCADRDELARDVDAGRVLRRLGPAFSVVAGEEPEEGVAVELGVQLYEEVARHQTSGGPFNFSSMDTPVMLPTLGDFAARGVSPLDLFLEEPRSLPTSSRTAELAAEELDFGRLAAGVLEVARRYRWQVSPLRLGEQSSIADLLRERDARSVRGAVQVVRNELRRRGLV